MVEVFVDPSKQKQPQKVGSRYRLECSNKKKFVFQITIILINISTKPSEIIPSEFNLDFTNLKAIKIL